MSCFQVMNPDISILENIMLSMDCSISRSPLRLIVGDILGLILLIVVLHLVESIIRFATNGIFNLDFNVKNIYKKLKKLIGDGFYNVIKNSSLVKSMLDKEQRKIEISFDKVTFSSTFSLTFLSVHFISGVEDQKSLYCYQQFFIAWNWSASLWNSGSDAKCY